jgi:hypothetical protein
MNDDKPSLMQLLTAAVELHNHKGSASSPCDRTSSSSPNPGPHSHDDVRDHLEVLSKRSLAGDTAARRELIELGFQELHRIEKTGRLRGLCEQVRRITAVVEGERN